VLKPKEFPLLLDLKVTINRQARKALITRLFGIDTGTIRRRNNLISPPLDPR
jgi:hypothetical protein